MLDKPNQKKSSFDILILIIYIAIYSLMLFYQNKIESYGNISIVIQGITSQLQLLLSAFIVVAVSKFGYYVALAINIFSALRLIIDVVTIQSGSAITGFISTVATIILITIIHIFYKRIMKNTTELIRTNEELRQKDEKLTYLAYYDILTGLPNRQLFIERIDEAINLKSSVPFTVISANIDNFKLINNDYGNNAGDAVLCSYSKKLKRFCGNSIFLARINADEFGMIVYGKESEDTIVNYIEAIREIVAEPIKFKDVKINVTMSFGVSSYPSDATASTEILKCVNSALSVSKFNGKNMHTFYNKTNSYNSYK